MRDLRSRIHNISDLARRLDSDYTHILYVLWGRRPDGRTVSPSVALAKRIEAATDGAIRWQEFFTEPGPSAA